MSCPTPAPHAVAAAAAEENRPAPLMKRMKQLLGSAVSWVFGGMKRSNGVGLVGSLAMLVAVRVLTFTADPEEARFWSWLPLLWAWLYFLFDTACWRCICYCMEYYCKPQLEQPAEAGEALQLPPPPPEMDMC